MNRLLTYVTGGISTSVYRFYEDRLLTQTWHPDSRNGPTAGIGAEYALNDHWIAGAEWNYYDFGKELGTGGISPAAIHFKESTNQVALRISYKF